MKVKFVLRGRLSENKMPVRLRFTDKKKVYYLTLPLIDDKIEPKKWNSEEGDFKRNVYMADMKNKQLDEWIEIANKVLVEMKINNQSSFDVFAEKMLSNISKKEVVSFCQMADNYLNNNPDDMAYKTILVYRCVLNKLKAVDDIIDINKINEDKAAQLVDLAFTKSKKFYTAITVYLFNKVAPKVNNPFKSLEYGVKKTSSSIPDFRTKDELDTIVNLYNTIKVMSDREIANYFKMRLDGVSHLIKSLKIYLFECYTSLRVSDILELQKKHIKEDSNGNIWIIKIIKKSKKAVNNTSSIPLLDVAIELLGDYSNLDEDNYIFPDIQYTSISNHLKKIAAKLNIKHFSTHSARHTFGINATRMGMRREVIQQIMVHSNPEMTAHYARVMSDSILNEMKLLNNK